MTAWVAETGAWLLQAAATLPDTIVTKQVETDPGAFSKLTSIASGLMTISILVLTVALVPAAWNFRKSYKKINELLDRVYGDINPLVRHASVIADNVDYITTSIRVDIQQVSRTIATANERLLEVVKVTEQRLGDFNALLGVVQEEAEDVFVSTAATMRGIRRGASTFGETGAPPARSRLTDSLDGELEDALDDDLEDTLDDTLDDVVDDVIDDVVDGSLEPVGDGLAFDVAGGRPRGEPVALPGDDDDTFDAGDMNDGDDRGDPPSYGRYEKPRIRPRGRTRGPAE